MGMGVSKGSYGNSATAPKIQGEIQGKGDVASLCVMISSTLLSACAIIYTDFLLPVVTVNNNIKENNDTSINDVDTYTR